MLRKCICPSGRPGYFVISKKTGQEGAINLEQLLPLEESIFENWNPESFDESLLVPVGAVMEHESFYKY